MNKPLDVAVLPGSLRKSAYSRKTANALKALAPPTLALDIVEISQLPLYNDDLDTGTPPAAWVDFRQRIAQADAFLFITPEYNRSVPAALKNALDVASRPYGHNVWAQKPGAIISVSPSAMAAFGANHHLRQSMVFLDIFVMQQPEAYLGNIGEAFDQTGALTSERTRSFLQRFIQSFADWTTNFCKD